VLLLALVSCHPAAVEHPVQHGPNTPAAAPDEDAPRLEADAEASEPADETADSAETDPETVEDDPEDAGIAEAGAETRPHPLDGLSDAELKRTVAEEPAKLGSISLGAPSAGLLLNGVQATESPYLKPVSPSGAYGTQETLDYLTGAIKRVHAEFPGTLPLSLGDISAKKGGRLKPHISHQSGRDVDISFYYRNDTQWYRRGNASNLDLARNWAFVRALVTETDVEMILVDHSIQALLRDYARSIGEDATWLEGLFLGGAGLRPILRHAPGHATHFHIRFFNPIAQETARRAYRHLVSHGLVPPVQDYTSYRTKRGDTLGKLAKRFGTSIEAIKRANGLKKSLIREKQVYLIPTKSSRPKPPPPQLSFPPRRLPPRAASAK
jgi:penicillin-insensitive murein endopeptidase